MHFTPLRFLTLYVIGSSLSLISLDNLDITGAGIKTVESSLGSATSWCARSVQPGNCVIPAEGHGFEPTQRQNLALCLSPRGILHRIFEWIPELLLTDWIRQTGLNWIGWIVQVVWDLDMNADYIFLLIWSYF